MSAQNPQPKRILIIKLRHHGDVLLMTPLATQLKKQYPDAQIDALIYKETIDILKFNNDFHQLYSIDRGWKKLGLRMHLSLELELLRVLKHNCYDLIIHLTESWRGALICRFCRPVKSISIDYPRRKGYWWKHSFTHLVKLHHEHTVLTHLRVLEPLDIPYSNNVPLKLLVANKDAVCVQQKLKELGWQKEPFILIHPGARWAFKCWDDEKMAKLIRLLLNDGGSVVLTGAPNEFEQTMISNIKQKMQLTKKDKLFDLSGQLSLSELSAAIAQSVCFVGVDSVPMHMAAALSIKGVALFGATKIDIWAPWSDSIRVIDASEYGQIPEPDSIDTNTSMRYLSCIPVQVVYQEVCKAIKNI
ncbi:putative lipopolysaccharide heptosyltransferase III [Neisseria sp. Ec49-e6-T10]|uniref:putative lipopolysaccharide heptosyltransferase III n=1 Tax=Neisseria sp. Ec49-e6-T10 TaxID=3140744 RepID=UPI003EBFEEB5